MKRGNWEKGGGRTWKEGEVVSNGKKKVKIEVPCSGKELPFDEAQMCDGDRILGCVLGQLVYLDELEGVWGLPKLDEWGKE